MPPLPPVTKAFLLACVGAFCFFYLFPGLEPWFELWPLTSPFFMPWQVLTYAFLHGGLWHLAFNMLGLCMFGGELERVWGPKRYTQILIASTLSAAVVQLLFTWATGSHSPTLGASAVSETGTIPGFTVGGRGGGTEARLPLEPCTPVVKNTAAATTAATNASTANPTNTWMDLRRRVGPMNLLTVWNHSAERSDVPASRLG